MTAFARRIPVLVAAFALALAALLPGPSPARAQHAPVDEPPEGERPQKPAWKGEIEPPTRLLERGEILIATDDTYPPMEFWDKGRIRGFDIDVGKGIAKLLGVEPHFVSTKWADLLPSVKRGIADAAISSIDITEERSKDVAFVEYMTLKQVFVVKRGAARVEKPEDLRGKKVAVQAETTSETLAREHAGPENVTSFASFQLAFDALRKGLAEVIVVDEPVAAHMARTDAKSFEVAGAATAGTPVGIALPKGDAALLKAITTAVARLKERGDMARITEKWLGAGAKGGKEAKPPPSLPPPSDDGEDLAPPK